MIKQKLRPYQVAPARAIIDSVMNGKGLSFSVEIARQGGKNELSAQLEVLLLTLFMKKGGNIVKCSPTFKPQTVNSMIRLKERLDDAGYTGFWQAELGYMVRLGKARVMFFSADESSNVVGATAHLLMEVDEAQDVAKEKYSKDFAPMGSTTNCTTVFYGTAWDDSTLLEEMKGHHLELERGDGVRRHFEYPWEEVAKHNPAYRAYVESERQRLGEDHPLFKTQYRLESLHGGGGFLSVQQRVQLVGQHLRMRSPAPGRTYVAGIDIAGEDEEQDDAALKSAKPARDSTVITIGELDYSICDELVKEPLVRVVEHYCFTGVRHAQLYPKMVDLLKNIWRVKRVMVDATGIGHSIAGFLVGALGGSVVEPFVFSAPSKSKLAYGFLAAVNAGRLKIYRNDGSQEQREFWFQMERAKSHLRANQTMNFYVDPVEGHDDFLISAALLVKAADEFRPRGARGRVGG